MVFTGESAGAFVRLLISSPILLALLLFGEVAVFYAFCLRHRRRYC